MFLSFIQSNITQLKRLYSDGCDSKLPIKCGCAEPSPAPPPPPERGRYEPPIPPNPCCVGTPHQPKARTFKYLFYFVGVPLIVFQMYMIHDIEKPPKGDCRDYEYMLVRTKRFPWGDGVKSLFHSDKYNHLPGECTEPAEDCD